MLGTGYELVDFFDKRVNFRDELNQALRDQDYAVILIVLRPGEDDLHKLLDQLS